MVSVLIQGGSELDDGTRLTGWDRCIRSGDRTREQVDISEFAERLYAELNRPKLKDEVHASQ